MPIQTDNNQPIDNQIELGINCKLMLTLNLCTAYGLTNGTTGRLYDIIPEKDVGPPGLPRALVVQFDDYKGQNSFSEKVKGLVAIPPKFLKFDNNGKNVCRKGFPLRAAESITIHKYQGQSFGIVIVKIGNKEITVGQTYTALSRVFHYSNMAIHDFTKND